MRENKRDDVCRQQNQKGIVAALQRLELANTLPNMESRIAGVGTTLSFKTDPRINDDINNVGSDISDQHQQARHDKNSQSHRIVSLQDGVVYPEIPSRRY